MKVAGYRDTFLKTIFIGCAALILAGCYGIAPYSVSQRNVANIREARSNIWLGEFAGGPSVVSCRATPIFANNQNSESKDAFAIYIREAFEKELASAGIKSGLPVSKVSVKMLNVDTTCGIFRDAFWTMEAEVTVEGKKPFIVKTRRDFEFTMAGEQIVHDAAAAFPSAVQAFIADIIAHPTFRSALYSGR